MNQKFRIRENGKTHFFDSIKDAIAKGLDLNYDKAEFFTGMQDVDGVDIYEGDVLEYEGDGGKWWMQGVVSFGRCCTAIMGSVEDCEAYCFTTGEERYSSPLDPTYTYRIVSE